MIISLSGKIGVGKDFTGKIIVIFLNNPHLNNDGVLTFLRKEVGYSGNWQIKKFADKLKDIVCILLGCTREQLEDREFKSKELGEEWWYWYMERDGGYSPIILDYLTTTKKELKIYEGLELIKPTPRFLLQFIGTNLFRNQLHPEIWVNALFADYKAKWVPTGDSVAEEDVSIKKEYPNWIITDLRFFNEMEAVKKRGGITIRVNRNLEESKDQHESETELDNAEFDYVIDNNGTIEELIEKVREILIKEKLIT